MCSHAVEDDCMLIVAERIDGADTGTHSCSTIVFEFHFIVTFAIELNIVSLGLVICLKMIDVTNIELC